MKIRVPFYFPVLLLLLPALLLSNVAIAKKGDDGAKPSRNSEVSVEAVSPVTVPAETSELMFLNPQGQNLVKEVEPNNDFTTAQALPGTEGVVLGYNFPGSDVDFYSFTANAGDRIYTAVMTSFSTSGTNSILDVISTDGSTILETDLDDGVFAGLSSTISGTTLPAGGTYFIRMRENATSQILPYHLHFKLQSGSPVPEVEPNDDNITAQPLPGSGWISGNLSSAADQDWYSLNLNAGDTVYVSLDGDPARDNTQWNPSLGVGILGGFILVINDGNAGTTGTNPVSEAHFTTVRVPGTYFVRVAAAAATFGDYHLSVSVHPAIPSCTTYTSTDGPLPIPDAGSVTSTLTVPGNPRIEDLNVTVSISHPLMTDMDVTLVSPAGNENGLFTDIGSAASASLDVDIDDEAALPISAFTVADEVGVLPELNFRLDWFDREDAGGTWSLIVRDDLATNTGTLNGWSVTICETAPPPTCPPGTVQTAVYSSDFEANDGGFTHSGTIDEWEWGSPTAIPITTCNSGTSCWKTDLDGTYENSSVHNLLSPNIDLTGLSAPIWVAWSQRYQLENTAFDHASLDVSEAGGANPTRLWEWQGPTMSTTVGTPSVTIQESAGWGDYIADISSYAGQNIELNFHLDTDTSVVLGGLAIDDVAVYTCQAGCPTITLSPSTLPNGTVGTLYDQTITASGGTGPYTFAVTSGTLPQGLTLDANTGQISGTPTTAEVANFTITATDDNSCTGEQAYTVTVACPTITLAPGTLPDSVVGALYDQTIVASGGTGPYTFAVTAGALPQGLTLDTNTGQISGTTTAEETANFTITATDANGCTGSQAYTINVSCPAITLSPTTLPDAIVGSAYDEAVSASGGNSPYAFGLTAGSLPTGLTLDANTGQISGTATAVGTFNFTITATDSFGCTGSQAYTVEIQPCPTITVAPPTLPGGTVGTPYSETVSASGGSGPYTFAVSAGALPSGLTLNSSTGEISGTPTTVETANFTITATDSIGCTGSTAYSVEIVAPVCPVITVSPATLPDGTIGTPYNEVITASGGTGPYTFAVTAGALPAGLTLDANTGVLSGTPTTEETANFTITATDSFTCTGSTSYTVNIDDVCLFCDDFEDGILDLNWTYVKNSSFWSESGGSLIATNSRKTTATANAAFPGGCTNCYVEATMQSAGGFANRVWLLHHFIDKNNLVELLMKEENDRWIIKQRIGKKVVARTKVQQTIDPNVAYTARITFDGTNYLVSINGVQIMTMTPVGPITGGTVGMKIKGTTGTFGYIEVN